MTKKTVKTIGQQYKLVYSPESEHFLYKEDILIIKPDGKKQRLIPTMLEDMQKAGKFIYLCYPHSPRTEQEAERLCQQGKAQKLEPKIILDFIENERKKYFSKEELCFLKYGMSCRSYNYLQKIKENIGFVDTGISIPEGAEEIDVIKSPCLDCSDVTIYQLANGQYATEYTVRTDIDDFETVIYIFSKRPNKKMFKTVEIIEKIEFGFKTGKYKENFTCWECGRKIFWTEVNGGLEDKLRGLQEHYCGC